MAEVVRLADQITDENRHEEVSVSEPLKLITQTESWKQEVREDVVETLRRTLARAEAGELTGVALAATCVDNCVLTTFSKREENALLLGGLSRLMHQMHCADDQVAGR